MISCWKVDASFVDKLTVLSLVRHCPGNKCFLCLLLRRLSSDRSRSHADPVGVQIYVPFYISQNRTPHPEIPPTAQSKLAQPTSMTSPFPSSPIVLANSSSHNMLRLPPFLLHKHLGREFWIRSRVLDHGSHIGLLSLARYPDVFLRRED